MVFLVFRGSGWRLGRAPIVGTKGCHSVSAGDWTGLRCRQEELAGSQSAVFSGVRGLPKRLGAFHVARLRYRREMKLLDANVTMGELLAEFPSARRALFQGYHIGGCSSCGFRDEETLGQVCARNGDLPVDEVLRKIEESQEADRKQQVDPAEAAELVASGRARIVDLRTREEFDAVHIEGSTFFTQDLMHELGGWDRDTLIIFIDHRGARSLDATAYFAGHGLTNVRAMRGGIDAWSCDVDPNLPRYELE